jgi:gelsolin
LSYFSGGVRLLEGGVDSGFHHVTEAQYTSRLLWIKGKNTIRVTQVPLSSKSLNSGDVFLLDGGLKIFQWNGSKSSPREKQRGALLSNAIKDERGGKPEITIIEEADKGTSVKPFWDLLGGEGPVAAAESVAADDEWDKGARMLLYRLSDASGKMELKLESKGPSLQRSLLDTNDAFLLDVGNEVMIELFCVVTFKDICLDRKEQFSI